MAIQSINSLEYVEFCEPDNKLKLKTYCININNIWIIDHVDTGNLYILLIVVCFDAVVLKGITTICVGYTFSNVCIFPQ